MSQSDNLEEIEAQCDIEDADCDENEQQIMLKQDVRVFTNNNN